MRGFTASILGCFGSRRICRFPNFSVGHWKSDFSRGICNRHEWYIGQPISRRVAELSKIAVANAASRGVEDSSAVASEPGNAEGTVSAMVFGSGFVARDAVLGSLIAGAVFADDGGL